MIQKYFAFKQKSVFFSWMFSYISVLLVPIVISIIVYFQTEAFVQNEINRANTALLKQVQQAMDNQLLDVEKLGLQIAWNPRVRGFMYVKHPLDFFQRYTTNQIIRDLMVYSTANEFIDEFYVFFKNTNLALTPNTINDAQMLYDLMHESEEITFDEWYKLMQNFRGKEYLPLYRKMDDGTIVRTIAFVQSLPIDNSSEPLANLVVLLDEIRFRQAVRNIKWINDGAAFIVDKKNRVLAATQPMELPQPLRYSLLQKSSDILSQNINGQEMTIAYIASQVTDWKYVSILPSAVFKEKSQYVNNITIVSIILCLILGGLAAYFFTMKNYVPVSELVEAICKKMGISLVSKGYNEYQFIHQILSATFDEKEKINEKLKQQNCVLRSNLLMKLIKGRLESSLCTYDTFFSFDITFVSDYFAVLLFYIEDYGDILETNDLEERIKLVQFIIVNVVEELARQNHQGFVTEVNEMMACLVNFREYEENTAKKELLRIAEEAQQFIREKFHVNITVSLSRIHQTLAGIPEAYEEALEAMEYKMVMGTGRIIQHHDISDPQSYYDYPLEMELQLINFCKAGDFEKAKDILNDIFHKNFANEDLSIEMAKCLLFDLVSTMIKALNVISSDSQISFIEKYNPVSRLLQCDTVMEMKYYMTEILKGVCEYIDRKKKSHNCQLKKDIIEFIQNNYHDLNISISMIANKFGMNPTYISRFFKEQTGEGLLDYINRVRLEKAKELLKKKGMNIYEAATLVGYSNSNALIRAFKKYEGITPGKFKELEPLT